VKWNLLQKNREEGREEGRRGARQGGGEGGREEGREAWSIVLNALAILAANMEEEHGHVKQRVLRLIKGASTQALLDAEACLRSHAGPPPTAASRNAAGITTGLPCKGCGGKRPPADGSEPWSVHTTVKVQGSLGSRQLFRLAHPSQQSAYLLNHALAVLGVFSFLRIPELGAP